jgi:sugar phosphate isomerase/epimerase
MKRRSFLGSLVFAGTAAAAARLSASQAQNKTSCNAACNKAKLNLALQWWRIPGKGDINSKLDYLESHGYQGVEIPANIDWLHKNASKLADSLKNRKLILGPACGGSDLSMADPEKRNREVARLCEIIEAIGAIGSSGLIVCPARGRPELSAKDLRNDFVTNTGKRLAECAVKNKTVIMLEPLRRNETPFLRQVPDGAKMAQEIGPGATVMADFWHMAGEESDMMGAMLCARGILSHVHIASLRNRRVPGTDGDADNYVDGFRGMKMLGYNGLVSFEGGLPPKGKDAKGKLIWLNNNDPQTSELLDAMCRLLREQWANA